MEVIITAILAEITNRSISYVAGKYLEVTGRPAMEDKWLQELQQLLLRAQTIVEEAEGRLITNRAVVYQLSIMRKEMYRGYFTLDSMRIQARERGRSQINWSPGGLTKNRWGQLTPIRACSSAPAREANDHDDVSHSFALSKFKRAKRLFSSYDGMIRNNDELQQVIRNLSNTVDDAKELVVFLKNYPLMYRQPYSMHLFVGECMFGRQMEVDMVMDFLMQNEHPSMRGVGVLPIVGPGYVGKSTLVAHVCYDVRVRNHFSRIVVHRGDEISGDPLASLNHGGSLIYQNNDLGEKKRELAIIEFSKNVDKLAWNNIYSSFSEFLVSGSKIIITSNSHKIKKFGTTQVLLLNFLPIEAYWYFFKVLTFGSADSNEHPKLESVAMELAREMGGSFIAANIISSILRKNLSAQYWGWCLTAFKENMQRSVSMFGEHPYDLLQKQKCACYRIKEDEYMVSEQYHASRLCGDNIQTTMYDVVSGNVNSEGAFEILAWKSHIRPYKSYTISCIIQKERHIKKTMHSTDLKHTLFWTDKWLQGKSIASLAPQPFALVPKRCAKKRSVQEMLLHNHWTQHIQGGLDLGIVGQVPASAQYRNAHQWHFSISGQYLTKSAYKAFFIGSVSFDHWESIWKIAFFKALLGEKALLLDNNSKVMAPTMEDKKLHNLERLLLRVHVIIEEAEGRYIMNQAMVHQLNVLRKEMYRGYFIMGNLKRQGTETNNYKGHDVSNSFILSKFNSVKRLFLSNVDIHRETDLQQVIDNLSNIMEDVNGIVVLLNNYPPLYRQPYSMHLFIEKCMFGRQMEMERIMTFLMQKEDQDCVGVLPIVGPTFVGKSTLVAHVCNDARVRNYFCQTMLITVQDINNESISTLKDGAVIMHQNNALDQNNERLLAIIELSGDIDVVAWNSLLSSSSCLGRVTKMIITSRSNKIMKFGTTQTLVLNFLPLEAYWYFFKISIFGSIDSSDHQELESIAMEIARGLNGSFMGANVTFSFLKNNLVAQCWQRYLSCFRENVQRNGHLGDCKPTTSLIRGDDEFAVWGRYSACSVEENLPTITMKDIICGCGKYEGEFDVLAWKSRILPYNSYTVKCVIENSECLAKDDVPVITTEDVLPGSVECQGDFE
ncbi:hypothetical protein U9M48_011490, partial [Paspalum notatum var. saurae]